jgi:hypothetical protein
MTINIKKSITFKDGYFWMESMAAEGYFALVEFGEWPYSCYVAKKNKEIISFCEGSIVHKIFSTKEEYEEEYNNIKKWEDVN